MNDRSRLFDLNVYPPVIQLFISASIVIIGGTLLFYLFVFAGSLVLGKDMSEILSIQPGANSDEGFILKYLQVSQQVALFIIPAIVIAMLLRQGNKSFLKTDRFPGSIPLFMVIMLAILILPVTTYTGMLNSRMTLPGWLSGVENWMRTKENTASDLTGLLIKSRGIGDLMINISILAVIPSVAEELIFRGILQQILCRIFKSGHIAICITAIFFSAVHLQFYGFLPRLILGLSFGYLFFWSGNLWIAVVAHFINNAIPVMMSHFIKWNDLSDKASDMVEKKVLIPLVPALLSIGILYYFWSEYRNKLVESAG
jgi:membrane protease YdiL (CAAX protease family)